MTVLRPVVAAAAPSLRPRLSVIVASQNAVKIDAVAAALRQALPTVEHRISGSKSQSGVADQPWGDEETLTGAFNRVESIRSQPDAAGSLLVAIEGGVGYAAPLPACSSGTAEGQVSGGMAAAAGPAGAAGTAGAQQQLQHGHLAPSPAWAQQWQHARQRQQHHAVQPPTAAEAGSQAGSLPRLECFAWVVVRSPCGGTSHARSASFPLPPAVSELMLREGLELGDADDRVFGRVKSGRGSGTIGQLTGGLITRQAYYQHAALMALLPLMNPQLYPEFDLSLLPGLDGQGQGQVQQLGAAEAATAAQCRE